MLRGDSIRKYAALGLVSLALQMLGCGTAAGPDEDQVPVSGTLKIDDKAVEGVTLLFSPADSSATRGGWGKTDGEGKFTITHNALNTPGIPSGAYIVTYFKFTQPDGSPVPEGKMPADVGAVQTLPPAWSDPSKAGPHNKVTIPSEGSTALDLKINTKLK